MIGVLTLLFLGQGMVDFFREYTRRQLSGQPPASVDAGYAMSQWNTALSGVAQHVAPILGLLLLGAVAVEIAQVGWLFLPEKAMPDLTRLDPLQGLRRIFSLPNLVRLAFGIFKLIVVSAVAYSAVAGQQKTILGLSGLSLPQAAGYLCEVLIWTVLKIAVALLILALLDYGFQRWKYEQDLRMTSQEVREELKNLEGNPQMIARRRFVQRQLAASRLSAAVPKADVVVTNPTELAVAIQYEPETMAAPIVVAKGAGLIAERIRRLAEEHGIPIVEKKPLARALYREVEINHPIPQDKYSAVAEILAYVYQLKGKRVPGAGHGA